MPHFDSGAQVKVNIKLTIHTEGMLGVAQDMCARHSAL